MHRPRPQDQGRFYVELLSKDALRRHMDYQGISVGKLAKKAGVSKATIGHLHSRGENSRWTVSTKSAKLIEQALGLPPCTLFLPKLEPVKRSTEQTSRAA